LDKALEKLPLPVIFSIHAKIGNKAKCLLTMRLGILSDIHSNIEALNASYNALKKTGCDKIVCVGDIIGYGASPGECIDFIRSNKIDSVRGNHDHYTVCRDKTWEIQPYALEAVKWTRNTISAEDLAWLDTLPYKMDVGGVLFVHSSLEALDGEYWPYILDTKSALFHFFLQETRFACFGHTHIPLLFTYDETHRVSIEILRSRTIDGHPASKFLLNPGSVGQPRDFDCRSCSMIFDTESGEAKVIRSEYDIASAQNKILAAGLPKILASRLSRGS